MDNVLDFLGKIPALESFMGMVVGTFIGPKVYLYSKKGFYLVTDFLTRGFNRFFKDPTIRIKIIAKIAQVQERLKSESGKNKMQSVIYFAKSIIPGKIDDIIIQNLCQACYDEFINLKIL